MQLPVQATAPEFSPRAGPRPAHRGSAWRRMRRILSEIGFDLALVALILAMLWSAIGYRLVEEHGALEHGAERATANIAGAAEQGVARTIEAIDQRLRFVRDAFRRDPDGFSLNYIASDSGYQDGVVMQIALIDAEGRLRLTNLGPTDRSMDLSDRPHFRIHLERSDDILHVSRPVLGRVSGRWSVQFTRKLYAADGRFAGVVVCSLDPYWLTQFHELLDISGNMLLLGADGVVRAAAPSVALLGRDLSATRLGRMVAEEDAGSLRMEETEDGPEQIISFRRLRNYPITVAVGMDLEPLLASYERIFVAMVSIGVGLTLLVAAAGFLMIRHKRRLIASREVLRNAVENLDQGLVMIDRAGRISLCNSRYVSMLELPAELAEPGSDYGQLVRWQAVQGEFGALHRNRSVEELLDAFTRTRAPGVRLKERIRPNGTVLEIRLRNLADGGMVCTFTDITDRRRAEAEIHHLAHHDGLTDLANRVLLEERLAQALALAERRGGGLAVLCLDLDRFKSINDGFGHGAGDELLRKVAQRLRMVARASDIVSRVGGDEFVLVQTVLSHPGDVASLAERLMAELSGPYELLGQSVSLEASMGMAVFPTDGRTVEALLKNATTALHRAKEAGHGAVCFFEPAMEARLRERNWMERDLRAALATRGISLYFQPLHDSATREVLAYEALLRWRHPERGFVSPAEFIPLAEECGLILPLGRWVLEEACAAAAAWTQPCTVAVNLSPAQFRRGNLPALVAEVLAGTGLPAHRLELEVTEGLLMEDAEGTLEVVRAVKRLGVGLALDDFGTGYSSLSYLRRFPFDKLKIDRSFIQAIGADAGARAIVEAILAMAHSLGLRVTAEGVETEEQLAFLRSHGCDQIQGFLLGRPMPAEQLPCRGPAGPWLAAG